MKPDFSQITREHAEQACLRVLEKGVTPGRESRGWNVIFDGHRLPVKETLGIAYELATGIRIGPDDYHGGEASAKWWRNLRFVVETPADTILPAVNSLRSTDVEDPHTPVNKILPSVNHPFWTVLEKQHQIILAGPPGTGKTYEAKRLVAAILGIPEAEINQSNPLFSTQERFIHRSKDDFSGHWSIVQFHPSYNYEDFVRGIKPVILKGNTAPSFRTEDRILAQMAKAALAHPDEKFVLIIDEINRANLASVLGELIYALEYREHAVQTPYAVGGENTLILPKNLFIIGTMNTADRSVGHIDYAVRRRFAFVPCLPNRHVLSSSYLLSSQVLQGKALDLFDTAARLFESSEDGGYLSRDFHRDDVQVGHTYFMAESLEELALRFAYQVYPLLREYYKDGVLIERNGPITLDVPFSFSLSQPETAELLFKRVAEWASR